MIKIFSDFCKYMLWIYLFIAITIGIIYFLIKAYSFIKKELSRRWVTFIKGKQNNEKSNQHNNSN